MTQVFEALFSFQFLLFCLAIYGLVAVFRRLVEFFILDNPKFKPTRTSKFWREVILPSAPVIIGLLITAFATKYPYPDLLTSKSGQLMFGVVGGITSGLVYKAFKSFFKKFTKSNES